MFATCGETQAEQIDRWIGGDFVHYSGNARR
ncbi:hypothetical protein NK6_2983 [Bradyrhizobium diazoefficiens]|uniref:Uncharacterized protein n=1 Tax=Bradyrhizobium diazoefficiens TaxID=1355477 RepID=A0A0E4BNR3_9BRAD|nr:hypothetical protein NK6_2983 [Bradyrhizobium diazoefficiens]